MIHRTAEAHDGEAAQVSGCGTDLAMVDDRTGSGARAAGGTTADGGRHCSGVHDSTAILVYPKGRSYGTIAGHERSDETS